VTIDERMYLFAHKGENIVRFDILFGIMTFAFGFTTKLDFVVKLSFSVQ